jgi:hypothetical protein
MSYLPNFFWRLLPRNIEISQQLRIDIFDLSDKNINTIISEIDLSLSIFSKRNYYNMENDGVKVYVLTLFLLLKGSLTNP